MAQIGQRAAQALTEILRADNGLPAAVDRLASLQSWELAPIMTAQIIAQHVSHEIAERTLRPRYPVVYVYCERITNLLREKFRVFSGKISIVMEIRVSQDHLEGLESGLQAYVDALTGVLDENRGEWKEGIYYGGGYEVRFGDIRHGGKNYLQAAKVSVELDGRLN